MNASPLRLIDENTIQIGSKRLHVSHSDVALSDGSTHNVEASAQRSRFQAHLEPYEMHGVAGKDIPEGLSILVDRVKGSLKNALDVTFENLGGIPRTSIRMGFDHTDWHIPVHLPEFAIQFKKLVEKVHPGWCVDIHETETGVDFYCHAMMAAEDDCFLVYRGMDEALRLRYRDCLRSYFEAGGRQLEAPFPDAHGFLWWVRHVAVPLIAAVLGAIALLIVQQLE